MIITLRVANDYNLQISAHYIELYVASVCANGALPSTINSSVIKIGSDLFLFSNSSLAHEQYKKSSKEW